MIRYLGANSLSIRLRAYTPFLQPVLVYTTLFKAVGVVATCGNKRNLAAMSTTVDSTVPLYFVRGGTALFNGYTTHLGAVEIAVTCLHSSDTTAICTTVGATFPP